jgi:hypothetical protein
LPFRFLQRYQECLEANLQVFDAFICLRITTVPFTELLKDLGYVTTLCRNRNFAETTGRRPSKFSLAWIPEQQVRYSPLPDSNATLPPTIVKSTRVFIISFSGIVVRSRSVMTISARYPFWILPLRSSINWANAEPRV